jgi:glycosyltransferase involved in cell wall biosynthesis
VIGNPKISVVTVCYNMESFIEQTIKSVIDQDYDNLEYIIIDGKSNDNTVSIVSKYREKISIFRSEPDKGQYDAIQKGMNLATGEILAWLNADDVYFPWTLGTVARIFSKFQDVKWLSGISAFIDEDGSLTHVYNSLNARPSGLISRGYFRKRLYGYLQQESMFWRRELWEKTGGLDLSLKLAGDFDLWTRFAQHAEHLTVGIPLAGFRIRETSRSKIQENSYEEEVRQICIKKPKPNFIIRRLASINQISNKLIRLLVWKKAWIYYYSVSQQKWVLSRRRRPISSVSLSQLMLELN